MKSATTVSALVAAATPMIVLSLAHPAAHARQVAVDHAVISSGGVVTPDGSIIILGQPIAGLACAPTGSPPPCIYAGFIPLLAPPSCPGDANGNNTVNFADITEVLKNWGLPGPSGDADGNNIVNFADITNVLEFWAVPCN